MGDVATLAGAGGLGILALVVGYLLNANRLDRKEYGEAIDKTEKRADKAEARAEALQQSVDDARTARRAAEDKADLLARELERYRPTAPGGAP